MVIAVLAMLPLAAPAAEPTKYFREMANKDGFDYSYVSPVMLKAMGNSMLSESNTTGISLNSSDLNFIETVNTEFHGTDDDLWTIIRKLKKDKKLENISTRKKDYYRYDVLAKMTGDNKYFTHIMVVTQNGASNVNVVYMEGKIPVESLRGSK